MRMRTVLSSLAVVGCASIAFAQGASEPRRLSFSGRPIVDSLRPTDEHVEVRYPGQRPAFSTVPRDKTVVAVVAENNPVVVVGRIVEMRAEFLDVWSAFPSYRVVSMLEANYIGSRVTVLLEDVTQPTAESPLREGGHLTFVYQYEGSAVVDGVKVDTETTWLWPIEEGGRYLIVGRFTNGSFEPSGMWLEQVSGGPLRGPVRIPARPERGIPFDMTDPMFEFDGLASMEGVVERLKEEVGRLNDRARQ